MSQVTLAGDRLGDGKKQKIDLHNYSRSSHDLGYIWRSTMASGTLVPFMSEVALPGDSFDIDLNVDIKTHPTIGPLFGSYKVQLDVFQCPVRLYNGKLHMNMLNIGLDMASIKLPQLKIYGPTNKNNINAQGDNGQINASCIYSYLNIRGLGWATDNADESHREFNAIPYLGYWDIYKNYYANKVEEIGAVIHNPMNYLTNTINLFILGKPGGTNIDITDTPNPQMYDLGENGYGVVGFSNANEPDKTSIKLNFTQNGITKTRPITEIFGSIIWSSTYNNFRLTNPYPEYWYGVEWNEWQFDGTAINPNNLAPQVTTFPLVNIDTMRQNILQDVYNTGNFIVNEGTLPPYTLIGKGNYTQQPYCQKSTMEGLGLKTYQSDLFNNWVSTEWIDGENGINAITSVDTSSGEFTIDTLQLSKKVYDMLNRIAVSGGSYDDWLDAVYTHQRTRSVENPMYLGGLSKELAFQEVISNAVGTGEDGVQPLGTIAGRGVMTNKHKGGKIKVKIDEPSYIIGIVSLTPRIDYSQGNKWDTNLKTMDDFHKPGLDQIGFQDLITDQMAWFDTEITPGHEQVFKSAGKQPAWINYMTNVNQVRGNFAEQNQQMWMTLNRRYEQGINGIEDLTTYIDPSKFNHIFADTRIDAQNFWTQIGVNIYARRKMSAKLMPNL